MTSSIKTVAVLGAGTMGAGIAQVSAQAGYTVVLYDLEQAFVDKALSGINAMLEKGKAKGKVTDEDIQAVTNNLTISTDLNDIKDADLVIEAVPESMELKQKIFKNLDESVNSNAILASNTSSLSITSIGAVTSRPEKVAGLHFFNPVPLMKLVEIIKGQQTSDDTIKTLTEFTQSLKKVPAVAKDTPGFIVNRVARPFYGEALKLLNEHQQSPNVVKAIDTVMKDCGGFKMGPFELMDLIGIDINHAVTQSVYNAYFQEPRYKPSIIQQKMVEAGTIGKKSGKGFYSYE